MQDKLRIPIGLEFFDTMRKDGYYYVDKTLMIRDIINAGNSVSLFTRPRRFGKTLNMTMLKCFFEIGQDKSLFDGLNIKKEIQLCEKYQNKYPVIFISLKDINGLNFDDAKDALCLCIRQEFSRHKYLLNNDKLDEFSKTNFIKYLTDMGLSMSELTFGLRFLSELLESYHGEKVVILIDEYDVPLDKAYNEGYYKEMASLIRGLFSHSLKTNNSLKFAVLTGCLRISKESFFTGLNNLKVYSILDKKFDEYFGFTEAEVKALLEYYSLTDYENVFRDWYDGYLFGNQNVYCPWDVLNYCADLLSGETKPRNYWANVSSNSIIKKFVDMADKFTKRELDSLVNGKTVKKLINETITYEDIYTNVNNLWTVLLMTGYLTLYNNSYDNDYSTLRIPNKEICLLFNSCFRTWFFEVAKADTESFGKFYQAFIDGDADGITESFTHYLQTTISLRDTYVQNSKKENFYHGLLLGLLSLCGSWYTRSNIESGDGYSDIIVEDVNGEYGFVIEIKYAENKDFDTALDRAMEQIDKMNYVENLRLNDIEDITKIAIACYNRRCKVRCEKVNLNDED